MIQNMTRFNPSNNCNMISIFGTMPRILPIMVQILDMNHFYLDMIFSDSYHEILKTLLTRDQHNATAQTSKQSLPTLFTQFMRWGMDFNASIERLNKFQVLLAHQSKRVLGYRHEHVSGGERPISATDLGETVTGVCAVRDFLEDSCRSFA